MLKDKVYSNSAHTADDDLKESIQHAVSVLHICMLKENISSSTHKYGL